MENKIASLARALIDHEQRVLNTKKEDAILESIKHKQEQLSFYQAEKEAELAAYQQTTVGVLNLNPYEDPFLHLLVNNTARVGAAMSAIAGGIVAGTESVLRTGFGDSNIPDDVREARARQLQSQLPLTNLGSAP